MNTLQYLMGMAIFTLLLAITINTIPEVPAAKLSEYLMGFSGAHFFMYLLKSYNIINFKG